MRSHTWMFNVNRQAPQLALVEKTQPGSAGEPRDTSSNPGSGRSPGDKNGDPLQYSCLENPGYKMITWVVTPNFLTLNFYTRWGRFRVPWQVTISGGQQRILAAGVPVFILPGRPSPAGCSLAWSSVPCVGHKGPVGHPCKIYSGSYAWLWNLLRKPNFFTCCSLSD